MKKEDLRCEDCTLKAIGAGQSDCKKHGKAQIDWKCQYCCSVALFHCFGTHYMCKKCHDCCDRVYPRIDTIPVAECDGTGKSCPLGVPHPPNGNDHKVSVFPLGCGLCRSENIEKEGRD